VLRTKLRRCARQSGAYGRRGPFGDVVLRPAASLAGEPPIRAEAELNGARLHGGSSQDLFHVTVQLGDDRRRRALGHEKSRTRSIPQPRRRLAP